MTESFLFVSTIIGVKIFQNKARTRVIEPKSVEIQKAPKTIDMVAVNYHFTRKCNYKCGFCFHTEKTSHVLPLDEAKRLLKELRDAGCLKVNFAGGEPFLPEYRYKYLAPLVRYAKEECRYESVSIITNGSHVEEKWLQENHQYLDILGVSCDSTNEEVNVKIGRGKGKHKEQVLRVAQWCHKYNVKFKLNTVVNAHNWEEDMTSFVRELNPMRWKIFQVLALEGENSGGNKTKRDVTPFLIDSEKYASFVERNRAGLDRPEIMKIEDNDTMQSSYILVDEYGRFLDCSTGGKQPTASVLSVGVSEALRQLASSEGGGFDREAFDRRDGYFPQEWSKTGAVGGAGGAGGGCSGCSGGGAAGTAADIEDLGREE